jgi:hypothetical protein
LEALRQRKPDPHDKRRPMLFPAGVPTMLS